MSDPTKWREAVLALADTHWERGHIAENNAVRHVGRPDRFWAAAECHREIYADLCALVDQLDPRPGADTARPW